MTDIRVPKEGNVFIATYGSLRTGMGNFPVNARGGGVSIGNGRTVENFNMYSLGGFPSLSLAHNSHGVPAVVEVFEAPETGMKGAYDRLEGYPSFYNRTPIEVAMDDGSSLTAWIYHIDEEQSTPVTKGDWVEYYNDKRR